MKALSSVELLLLLLLVSCIKEPLSLCEQEPKDDNLEIFPQWEASVTQPPGVYVDSYSQMQNAIPNFLPPTGGWIYLPKGTYNILLYSNASTKVEFRNMGTLTTAEAYTETGVQPDELYRGKAVEVVVQGGEAKQRIEVPMQNLVYTYPFTYRGVTGLKYVNEVRVSINGISQAVRLTDGSLLTDTHTVTCIYTLSLDGFYGHFRCFGHGGATDKNLFVVRFNYGGRWQEYAYDVSEMLEKAGRIDIYEPIVFEPLNSGGMDTDVGDWEDDTVDIPIK